MAPRAAAQKGTLQFEAKITPSSGVQEPVRSFPFYLLSKSYADIEKEATSDLPAPNMDKFIDSLEVSKQMKAWMKANHWVNLTGEDFHKKIKVDDVMNVPEFFTAYVERMAGDQTVAFPTPKYKLEDKTKDPAKYERLVKSYHDAIRAFIIADPGSTDGIELGLEDINPGHKWDVLSAKTGDEVNRETMDLAQGKYLVARTETDLQGQGSIRGIAPGNYWLSTLNITADAGDTRERWDVPVTVGANPNNFVALSNINAVRPAHVVNP